MLNDLIEQNRAWSLERSDADPGYFARLAAQQAPEFLWIGCSDSRVPANVVAGLDPGEVFVHRNVANIVHSSDMNLLSALEFAVDELKVSEIIVCGHYGCGGIKAAMSETPSGLTTAERASLAWAVLRSLTPDDAQEVIKAALPETVGTPVASLVCHMDEAAFWADMAEPDALEAYCLACFNRLAPARRSAFIDYVAGRAAA